MLTQPRVLPLDRIATINRALDHVLTSALTERAWVPAADVIETKDAYLVSAELPGVRASQIDMSFEKSVLVIRGVKNSMLDDHKAEGTRVYAAERHAGVFERVIRLPDFVDPSGISAELSDGVLVVTVPKAAAAQARRIEIKTEQGDGQTK